MNSARKCLKIRLQGHIHDGVVGTSGAVVKNYVDCRPLLMDNEFLRKVCHELSFMTTLRAGHSFVGLETGGAILAAAMSMRNSLPGAYISKGKSNFMPDRRLVGYPTSDVYVVDDVVTTGSTVIAAIKLLLKLGHNVLGAICIVDHKEHGGWNRVLVETDVTLHSLFTIDDNSVLTSLWER